MKIILILLTTMIFITVWGRTAEEWRTRTIYQIVTDRFGRTDDELPVCRNLSDYCGGTFKGIQKNLDYIQGLGTNAIWISPVIKTAPGGYHGYWPINMYEINPNFGTSQDLIELIEACHARDIWVMVDVVPNHVSPVPNDGTNYDFSGIYPFNDAKYYHWPIYACKYIDDFHPYNQTALEHCWLLNLPDLNHEDEFVSQTLIEWVKDFTNTYKVDGLRLDAVRHVPKWFWKKFSEAAGVFTIGEVWNHDVKYCSGYQKVMSSLLNFPLHGMLDKIFLHGDRMSDLTDFYKECIADWDDITVLGNFVVNQDFKRFLHDNQDVATYKAYYAYTLTSVGMPIVYYGDEQSLTGGIDPENRETLWGKMNPDAEMYQYLKKIITFKNKSQYHNYAQIERLVEDDFYAFNRGEYFFAFTNSEQVQTRTIKSHPYAEGAVLCSIFNEKACIQVKNGEFQITIMNKEAQILAPQQPSETEAGTVAWKNLKQIWSSVQAADVTKHNSI